MFSFSGYICTESEAFLLIHAVRLKLITSTPTSLRRRNVDSGNIYLFTEENEFKNWKDNLNWTFSNFSGHFHIFKENKILDYSLSQFNLHKKIISIFFNNVQYYIVSYYRPMFSKKSLLTIPFFEKINYAIKNEKNLLHNFFVDQMLKNSRKFYREHKLEKYSSQNNYPLIEESYDADVIKILLNLIKRE